MMDNNLYTKGDREQVIKRFDNVHTITIYCPLQFECVKYLKMSLVSNLMGYMSREEDCDVSDSENEVDYDSNTFTKIPTIDMFNCFIVTLNCCKGENIPPDVLYSIWSVIQSFKFLKFINVVFTDDEIVYESYSKIKDKDKSNLFEVVKNIYKVEALEIRLYDLFTQEIVDILNKTFVFDEVIENEYLKREFLIMFHFDDYMSFMNMFTNNNGSLFDSLDVNIIDYLLMFPKIVTRDKPKIRLITNYQNL